MIDKLWYDWQRQDSSNKNAFGGGSISFLASSNASIIQYPNGAPPWLNVRGESFFFYIVIVVRVPSLTFNRRAP